MYTIAVIFLAILLLIAIYFPFCRKKRSDLDWERKSTLWFQELIKRFQDRFPEQPFHIHESDPSAIVVPPKHSAVGELWIYDGGTHIIVEINPFLHQDFDLLGRNLDEGREALVVDVLLFLKEIFEDKIEFYGRPNGCSHQERGKKPRGFVSKLFFGKTTYVWSGPIEER
jgi:cbb3-type cytochrome oxidase subunit 3